MVPRMDWFTARTGLLWGYLCLLCMASPTLDEAAACVAGCVGEVFVGFQFQGGSLLAWRNVLGRWG